MWSTISLGVPSFNNPVSVLSVFGWIVIQSRTDVTTSWSKNWANYKAGFGTLGANYWLGLETIIFIYLITLMRPRKLRLTVT